MFSSIFFGGDFFVGMGSLFWGDFFLLFCLVDFFRVIFLVWFGMGSKGNAGFSWKHSLGRFGWWSG